MLRLKRLLVKNFEPLVICSRTHGGGFRWKAVNHCPLANVMHKQLCLCRPALLLPPPRVSPGSRHAAGGCDYTEALCGCFACLPLSPLSGQLLLLSLFVASALLQRYSTGKRERETQTSSWHPGCFSQKSLRFMWLLILTQYIKKGLIKIILGA